MKADAIVVGGGVVGASVAFHLAQAGLEVRVLERVDVASGATGSSTGFVRTYHRHAALTRLAQASREDLERWSPEMGGSIGFVRTGCLYRLNGAEEERPGTTSLDDGDEWSVVDASLLRRRFRWVRWPEASYVYEPQAGYASPWACADGYLRRLQEMRGEVHKGVTVTGLRTKAGRLSGVDTSAGTFHAPVAVLATGPWVTRSRFACPEGILRTKRIVVQRVSLEGRLGGVPAYIDEGTDPVYFRPKGTRELMLGGTEGMWDEDPDSRASELDHRALRSNLKRMERMVGVRASPLGVVTGVDAYSPDGLPLIDRFGPRGLFLAAGFSGSGFKVAPAAGRLLAEWISGGRRPRLLTPFGLDRFGKLAEPAGSGAPA